MDPTAAQGKVVKNRGSKEQSVRRMQAKNGSQRLEERINFEKKYKQAKFNDNRKGECPATMHNQ